MDRLELTGLARILRVWGGEEDCVELTEDVQDMYWIELGYDCLSVLQTTGSIERKYDVLLDGELLELADTPGVSSGSSTRSWAAGPPSCDPPGPGACGTRATFQGPPAVADRLCVKR